MNDSEPRGDPRYGLPREVTLTAVQYLRKLPVVHSLLLLFDKPCFHCVHMVPVFLALS